MSTTQKVIALAIEQEYEEAIALGLDPFDSERDVETGTPLDLDWPDEPALTEAEQAAVDLEVEERATEWEAEWVRRNGPVPF